MNNWSISIHIFFLWFQIYICSEFENEHFTGRRSSNHGNLIKTKSGKTFLQRSSKGKKYNTEIQKYNRQIKYHAQETDSGFDEYSQVNIIGWVIRENYLEGALSVENVPKDNSTHVFNSKLGACFTLLLLGKHCWRNRQLTRWLQLTRWEYLTDFLASQDAPEVMIVTLPSHTITQR